MPSEQNGKASVSAGACRQNKTAPAPPAVQAPVFLPALLVTEGLKSAIPENGKSTCGGDLDRFCNPMRPDLSSRCQHFVKVRRIVRRVAVDSGASAEFSAFSPVKELQRRRSPRIRRDRWGIPREKSRWLSKPRNTSRRDDAPRWPRSTAPARAGIRRSDARRHFLPA